jgi:hypothetical protein
VEKLIQAIDIMMISFRRHVTGVLGSGERFVLYRPITWDGRRITFKDFINHLSDETETSFREGFLQSVRETSREFGQNEKVFFECPRVSLEIVATTPFEYVLIDASAVLDYTSADPSPFMDKLRAASPDSQSMSFLNLSGDACLVVPVPTGGRDARTMPYCSDLAAFANQRDISDAQHELLVHLGLTFFNMLKTYPGEPQWLSTHGGGVAWLHFRICGNPKYYHNTIYSSKR